MSNAGLLILARLLATMRNLIDTMIAVVEGEMQQAVAPVETTVDEAGIITGLNIPTFGERPRAAPGRSTNPAPNSEEI